MWLLFLYCCWLWCFCLWILAQPTPLSLSPPHSLMLLFRLEWRKRWEQGKSPLSSASRLGVSGEWRLGVPWLLSVSTLRPCHRVLGEWSKWDLSSVFDCSRTTSFSLAICSFLGDFWWVGGWSVDWFRPAHVLERFGFSLIWFPWILLNFDGWELLGVFGSEFYHETWEKRDLESFSPFLFI